MKRTQLGILLAFAAFAALTLLWMRSRSGDAGLRGRAASHREMALQVLGEYLAERHPHGKALIVSNPFVQQGSPDADTRRFEEAGVRGLTRGWGTRIQSLGTVYPKLRAEAQTNPESVPIDPESKTPLSFLQVPRAWDELLQTHPDADLWVSLIGVPLDLTSQEFWRRPKPALALLLPDVRMLGGRDGITAALLSGKLTALILARPGSPPDSEASAPDARAEFERRFILVTRENLRDVLALYPTLL